MHGKKYTFIFAHENKNSFDNIQSGRKTLETRAGSLKYQTIKVGDILVMYCDGERFEKKVTRVAHFDSIRDLLKVYSVKRINPDLDTEEELTYTYYSYPGYEERIKKFGMLVFELG